MIIVGLTGGIATGKSTVSERLKKNHCIKIIDADLIAKQVVEPGKTAYNEIINYFLQYVPDLTLPDGSLNRAALGKAVFGNSDRLRILNGITHPAVRREIFWQIFKSWITFKDLVVLDVPLLFEAGLDKICVLTVNVSCSRDSQLERLIKRNGLSIEEAEKRIDSQMSSEERNERADKIIDNSGDLTDLNDEIDLLVLEIRPPFLQTLIMMIPPVGIFWAIWTLIYRRSYRKSKSKTD